VKQKPLDYASPQPSSNTKQNWKRLAFGMASAIFGLIALWLVAIVIGVMNSEWPFPVVYVLLGPAACFGVLAVFALVESIRRGKNST
jgi:hypothetical protein